MPSPVQSQSGCAGGQCGITATLTPNSGPTGCQVTVNISSGSYPLGGKYEIWWSKSATMADDPTSVRLAEGFNENLKRSITITLSVPEASGGTNYFHYIKAGRSEQMLNFSFQVVPTLIMREEKIMVGSSVNILGTGFTSLDEVSLFIDGEPSSKTAQTDKMGSFTCDLPVPDLMAGTHVIKATAKRLFNQEGTLRFKVTPLIKVEPDVPIVGKSATITGSGFAANSEVSIKYDQTVITSSPTSDKNGRFVSNFPVPETASSTHSLTATDKAGNVAVWELPVENNPPTTPTPVMPTSERFGIMGTQPVNFTWMPAKDDSGNVVYTLEVADNLNFFPLLPGMRKTNLTEPGSTMNLEPGTYYWRVQASDPSGNKSKWALSPYAFQVGLINIWLVAGVSLIMLVIFIILLRAFIQRIRGYYY